jgi:acyl transferase domain-containing protein/SAM-dependent methyltransferase
VKRALQEIRELRGRLAEAEAAAAQLSAPIAIIGMGVRFPGGVVDQDSFWELLAEGKDAITDIPSDRWDWRQYFDANPEAHGAMYAARGGFLDGIDLFDADFFGIAPREAVMLDPQQRLLHEVAWHALEDAAIRPDRLRNSNTGIFFGLSNFDYYRAVLQDDLGIDAYAGSGNSPSMAAGRLAYTLGVHGPALTIDTSCSSSLAAVHLASQSLHAGECDLALAGGVNVILAPQMHIGFSRARMLSPDGHCKTFDQAADGYVRSEGCAVVALKRLPDAVQNGDRILAVIRATATNHDGRSGGLTAPSSQAQIALLRGVYEKAGIAAEDVGMIEAHGTGTSLGDPIEMEALGEVFRSRAASFGPIAIGSVKTNLGHTEAASGMAGLLKTVLSLQHQQIPRHLHLDHPSAFIPWKQLPFEVPLQTKEWKLGPGQSRRIAGVSSFGFSGSNAHVILEEYVAESMAARSTSIQVATISARTPDALDAFQRKLLAYVQSHPEAYLQDICQTLSRGRAHHGFRKAFVASTGEELLRSLGVETSLEPSLSEEDNAGSFCFLFTGQGSEHSGMGLELFERDLTFRTAIEHLDTALNGTLDKSIRDIWKNGQGELERASLVQPALFAYGWGLASLWKSWGVEPRVVIGHSLGEYVAATVAGVMTPHEGIRLVAARGRLIEQLAEPGAMLTIGASLKMIEQVLAETPGGVELSLAAINGPDSAVVSGSLSLIAELEARLGTLQLRYRRLRTTHGFHSATLDPMLDEFAAEAAKIQYKIPEVSWISNLTGKLVERNRPIDASYWRDHLRSTVRFSDGLHAANQFGVGTYLEIGAQPQLLAAAEANGISPERSVPCFAKGGGGGEWQKLLTSAARLYSRGTDLDWDVIAGQAPYQKLSLPGYPFQRKHFWFHDGNAPSTDFPQRMAEAARDQASMVPLALRVDRIGERQMAVNNWAVALIVDTLRQLGCFRADRGYLTSHDLIEKFGVNSSHTNLMERWLRRLAQLGIFEQVSSEESPQYRLSSHAVLHDPGKQWRENQHLFADDEPLRDFLRNCAHRLLPVLRGEMSPLETLFPEGDGGLAKALYEHSPGSAYANRIAAAAVAQRARVSSRTTLGFPRRLRILEIGAGTGSTTAAVLAQLAPESVLYTFSDLSDVFLSRARARFGRYPMEFTLFDLDNEDHAHSHEGRFDVVLIANALHAAKDLRLALSRVREVLQPGGSLVLIETTSTQAWHDVSTGLIEGWQHFSDDARGDGSPLLPIEGWAQELGRSGFEQFSSHPSSDYPTHVLGLHVLLAQKPPEATSELSKKANALTVHQTTFASPEGRPYDRSSLVDGARLDPAQNAMKRLVEEIASASPRQRVAIAVNATTEAVAQTLGRTSLPHRTDRLMDIGLDSLMAIELRNQLQVQFGVQQLPSTLIFDFPTSEAIAIALLEKLGYGQDGQDFPFVSAKVAFNDAPIHSEEELDAMSDDEIAELLRMQLGQ